MTTRQNTKAAITVHLPVRLDEIDYLRIVHASNYLKYMEHARLKLLEQQGVDLMELLKKGIRFVVANDTINYRNPATYGDVLAITCRIEEIGESGLKLSTTFWSGKRERRYSRLPRMLLPSTLMVNQHPFPRK
jgi:YbgC/YbaW family acyl-CoA thioester hydrolase